MRTLFGHLCEGLVGAHCKTLECPAASEHQRRVRGARRGRGGVADALRAGPGGGGGQRGYMKIE